MNYILELLHKIHNKAKPRMISLSLFLGIFIILTALFSWWALAPSYEVLFNHLDEKDANQISTQLEQANINYQIRENGSEIRIDKNLIPKTRLKIMGSGMQLAGSVGFELFDKSDFGMTDFSQKINYQRALQGELERTISSFEEIKNVRVHLMIPENHLFEKAEDLPKAAVTLHLKQELTTKQVRSIQELIAATVAHLTTAHVVIVDQNGNALSRTTKAHSSSHLTAKKSVERYLSDKVLHMLGLIFGEDKVMVKIDATLNYDELQREVLKPQNKGQITHEKEIKNASSNKTDKDKTSQISTLEKSYQFGSEKESFKRANGTIEHLSISVVVPQNTSVQTKEQVQRLVQNIVGFNKQRGDLISVEALITVPKKLSRPQYTPEQAKNTPNSYKDLSLFLFIILILITLPIAVLIRLRHKRRHLLLIELTQWLAHHE